MCNRNINWLPLACPQTRDLACNPGMYPDWESNQWPFRSQASTQSTEPHKLEPILMPFRASAVFCFTSSTLAKHFPLRNFFIQGNKNRLSGQDRVNWGKPGGHAIFGQKMLNTECGVGRCSCKSPIMKWANTLKDSSKKFTEAKCSLSQQCQLVHWYRWVPRTLT